MVGIWGVGGIGKTTLAKAVYNSVAYKFEGSCFLANVREELMTSDGFVRLQKILFCEILGRKENLASTVDQGITMIKETMSNKRVLLILDDVDDFDRLNNLVGNPNWFGSGSRIIITTRDKHCLTSYDISESEIYEVEKLSHHEALELFNFNAFQDHNDKEDYVELVKNVLLYAQGLPLALGVLAAHLRGRNVNQWKCALDSPPKQGIQEVLKISYHALEPSIKEAFLHIACFFKGKRKDYVTEVLKACNLPEYAIDLLEEKALIVVTENDKIQMHDLLEEMGREIVVRESPNEPGQRSRLWRYEDVYDVFEKNTGSHKVQGIVLNSWEGERICLRSKIFSTLINLQVFILPCNIFTGDHVNYLSNELRILNWPDCPLLSFPSNFNPKNLVLLSMDHSKTSPLGEVPKILFQLKMPWSSKTPLGKGVKMQSLKSIDLSLCYGLTKLGHFSRFPNLVDLSLAGCRNLVEVDPSIGFLKNLVSLHLGYCWKLKKFEIMEEMKSLKYLNLERTAIKEISSSIRHLISLEKLILRECGNLVEVDPSIGFLNNLVRLDLGGCWKLKKFEIMEEMKSLKYLDLECTGIKEISSSIRHLISLEDLILRGCERLTDVSSNIFELQHLRHLDLSRCDSLVTFPTKSGFSTSLQGKHYDPLFISLSSCKNLTEISEFPREIDGLDVGCCRALKKISKLSDISEGKDSKMIPSMNLFDCDVLCRNLARMAKSHLRDDSAEAVQLSTLFLSCQQSEFEIFYPIVKFPFELVQPDSVCPYRLSFLGQGWPPYKLEIKFPGDFNWENKGLAFCDGSIGKKGFRHYTIYINGVRIQETYTGCEGVGELLWNHVWLYYVPFHTIIRRLSESGLPPHSMCLVKLEFNVEVLGNIHGQCCVHLVMPEDCDGVIIHQLS